MLGRERIRPDWRRDEPYRQARTNTSISLAGARFARWSPSLDRWPARSEDLDRVWLLFDSAPASVWALLAATRFRFQFSAQMGTGIRTGAAWRTSCIAWIPFESSQRIRYHPLQHQLSRTRGDSIASLRWMITRIPHPCYPSWHAHRPARGAVADLARGVVPPAKYRSKRRQRAGVVSTSTDRTNARCESHDWAWNELVCVGVIAKLAMAVRSPAQHPSQRCKSASVGGTRCDGFYTRCQPRDLGWN